MATAKKDMNPLRTVLMLMSVPERPLARLREEFPEIRFIVPESEFDSSGRYSGSPEEPTAEQLSAADGIVAWRVTPEMMADAPRLQWIHAGGAGVNSYELDDIAARGITLTNSSGVAAPNIAEHLLGMMLALARRIPRLVRAQGKREWRDHETHQEVAELLGQSLLLVGVGDIGQEVARRAGAFGMDVRGVRRRSQGEPVPGFDRMYGIAALHDALADVDQVAITLPETPQTRGLFDAHAFAAMKPGAIVYNVGRGPVIDMAALIDALETGRLGGAGLDVTDPEPLPADSPLWDMENVLITSHTSGSTPKYWDRLGPLVAENIRRIQNGETPRNVVDLKAGY